MLLEVRGQLRQTQRAKARARNTVLRRMPAGMPPIQAGDGEEKAMFVRSLDRDLQRAGEPPFEGCQPPQSGRSEVPVAALARIRRAPAAPLGILGLQVFCDTKPARDAERLLADDARANRGPARRRRSGQSARRARRRRRRDAWARALSPGRRRAVIGSARCRSAVQARRSTRRAGPAATDAWCRRSP